MPDYLKAREVEVFRIISEWKSMDSQAGGFPGLAERLAAHVEKVHAAGVRAGQEQARAALIEWAHRQELALRMVIDDSDGEEETAGELRIVLHTWEQVSREARRLALEAGE